jgi:outer membrane biosynthesis protein TonB
MSHMKRLRKVVDSLHDLADSITDMAEAMEGIEPTPAEVPVAVLDHTPKPTAPGTAEIPVAEPKTEEKAAPSPEPQPEPEPTPAPVVKKAKGKRKVTKDDLHNAIKPLLLDNRHQEVKALFLKYNAGKLSEVQEKDFEAFLREAQDL